MEDVETVCKECKKRFVCSAGEQNFLSEAFGDNFKLPHRCIECRKQRRGGKPEHAAPSKPTYVNNDSYTDVWDNGGPVTRHSRR